MKRILGVLVFTWLLSASPVFAASATGGETRLKDLSRARDERANALVGYGLVTGLAGTGDNPTNRLTGQTISNVLQNMGVNIPQQSLRSRNVAAVMVTGSLPRYAQSGDLVDVNVTSIGDARSLVGGTLLMTPLKAANGEVFALAQGALSIGGYKYDLNGNVVQKNHPTAGNIPNGATVERGTPTRVAALGASVEYVLFEPDLMTVTRIVDAINVAYGGGRARVVDPGRYEVALPEQDRSRAYEFLAKVESLVIAPDQRARVVVNERTGTVVSGGDVRISQTTISHGDLVVAITTDYTVSQPTVFGRSSSPSISTVVVPNTRIDVAEKEPVSVNLPTDTTVAELVTALNRVKASSRDVITILQGLKTAGALHAELVIQ
jgi:flagellar P-ring protein precursor FlgI